ncbi:heterogeneous nuclear ribonucleoprotein 1-like [Actinidia eriantha]|uniref:heterogeneous nuclear ribonucleoprotein 1-like n=1 Tax=Actinidia eriantha TaxID=165200 RepID=UPI00258CDC75|nr:heterogeneous nuclear ribonucleoprotein 1-like [Actinidia eriantha]
MDSDQGKLFIKGISWETIEDMLNDYFGNYGEVLQTVIMRDKISGRPGVFADPSVLDRVLQGKLVIHCSRENGEIRPRSHNRCLLPSVSVMYFYVIRELLVVELWKLKRSVFSRLVYCATDVSTNHNEHNSLGLSIRFAW